MSRIVFLMVIFGALFNNAQAVEDINPFPSEELQQRYHTLIEQLRCPKCQNQTLADSNSMIAQDLRNEVKKLLLEGKTDREIEDYLVARYGEFVLYKPRLNQATQLLWYTPFLLLVVGVLVVAGIVIRQKKAAAKAAEPIDEQRLKQLLEQTDGNASE